MRLKQLETIKIGNKPYVKVDKRIAHAAENYDYNVKIKSCKYIHELKAWFVEILLEIKWDKDQEFYNIYEGAASEVIGDGMVNKSSALENCYTSAEGKAFASAGIGIHHGTASGDEMEKALRQNEIIDKNFNLIQQNLKGYQKRYPDFLAFEEHLNSKAINLDSEKLSQLSKIWNSKAA